MVWVWCGCGWGEVRCGCGVRVVWVWVMCGIVWVWCACRVRYSPVSLLTTVLTRIAGPSLTAHYCQQLLTRISPLVRRRFPPQRCDQHRHSCLYGHHSHQADPKCSPHARERRVGGAGSCLGSGGRDERPPTCQRTRWLEEEQPLQKVSTLLPPAATYSRQAVLVLGGWGRGGQFVGAPGDSRVRIRLADKVRTWTCSRIVSPTTYLLPATHYLLPTTHYPLPTTYLLLPPTDNMIDMLRKFQDFTC